MMEQILTITIRERVLTVLADHDDPYIEVNLAETDVLRRCELNGKVLELDLCFPYAMGADKGIGESVKA